MDPLIDVGDPQQMNAYSYSNNSPITYTDPAGTRPMVTDNPADEDKYWSDPDNGKLTKGSGGKWTVTGGTSKPTTSTPSTPAESPEVKAARARAEKAKQQLINAGKALGKILMDELGITDALDCITKGDIGACAETVLNIAESFIGGLVAKIARKYGLPNKWGRAADIGRKLWDLGGQIVSGIKTWMKETKLVKALMSSGGCGHSFRAGTLVLMADGSMKRIEEVDVGDKVMATDPGSGQSKPKEVTATHVNQDEEFTDVQVADEQGAKSTLNTTANHPFWSATDRDWVDAGDLDAGDQLRTSQDSRVTVVSLASYADQRTMYDLTVKDIHTYYVLAGNTPVLVHNTGGDLELCRVSPPSRGDKERVQGLDPDDFPDFDENGDIATGAAHFGNSERTTDFAVNNPHRAGDGFKVRVPGQWVRDNNIEIWDGMGDQKEYLIPRDLIPEFNQFGRDGWKPGQK